MRSSILAILFAATALQSVGQATVVKGTNVLMPSKLMVRYTVGTEPCSATLSNDKALDVGCSLYYNQPVADVFKLLVDTVQASKISVFAPSYGDSPYGAGYKQALSADEVMHNLGQEISKVYHDDSTGNHEVSESLRPYDISELKGLFFLEEWALSETPFEFTKWVVAYSPIRKYLKENSESYCYSIPFVVVDSLQNEQDIEKSNRRMLLTNRVKHEYLFNLPNSFWSRQAEFDQYNKLTDEESTFLVASNDAPFLSRYGVEHLLNLLLDKAMKDNYPVYDFETQQRLSVDRINANVGIGIDTVRLMNFDGTISVLTKQRTLEPGDFKSVIFHEEWYVDPETLRMQKKVVGLTPVRYYYDEEDTEKSKLKRKAVFTIYFDKNKKF
ncbi:hypothetical protein [uncultured Acetobacteroides sp.]|uniref:hypothetical protein n=1 Tax=uncultured Acetobacteroides sp. TaxID=1760811 RepID=UPI0029F4EA93|nr:hypothetical protein [uncultured Acetobacteroides sp.]